MASYIAFEGGEGSGKSTQAAILAERLGGRILLVFGLMVAGASYLAVAHASSFMGFAFCFLAAGVGAGVAAGLRGMPRSIAAAI